MTMVFQLAKGARLPVAAQTVGETLETISEQNKGLTPKAVVDASRAENAPLHPCFDWNDATAAESYREMQARYVIRSVVVKSDTPESKGPVRAFVSVQRLRDEDQETVYIRTQDAMADPELRKQVLQRALDEIQTWRRKYASYKELADVFISIDAVQLKLSDAA